MRTLSGRPGHIALIALIGAAVPGITGCDDDILGSSAFEAEEPFSFAVELTSQTRIRLTGINSLIVVTGVAATDSVRVSGTRSVRSESLADAEEHLPDLEVRVESDADEVAVRTIQPANSGGRNYQVDYQLTVPDDFETTIVNANGTITVDNINNTVSVINANGEITLAQITGNIFADQGNGEVACEATLPLDGTFDIAVGNGEIALAISDTTSAQLSASVGTGDIDTFGLDLQNESRTATTLSGTLGGGRGTIALSVGNGTITVSGT